METAPTSERFLPGYLVNPQYDETTRKQLASIEANTLRAPVGLHDDRADAYALALVVLAQWRSFCGAAGSFLGQGERLARCWVVGAVGKNEAVVYFGMRFCWWFM